MEREPPRPEFCGVGKQVTVGRKICRYLYPPDKAFIKLRFDEGPETTVGGRNVHIGKWWQVLLVCVKDNDCGTNAGHDIGAAVQITGGIMKL